jgi:hypothetical protein
MGRIQENTFQPFNIKNTPGHYGCCTDADVTAICYNLDTNGMHKNYFVTKLGLLRYNDMGLIL